MSLRPHIALLLMQALWMGSISAATFVWDGGGADDNISTAANWNPDGAPASATATDLDFDGSTRLNPDLDSAFTANEIYFKSSAGSFDLQSTGSNVLTIAVNGFTQNIHNDSASAQTISLDIDVVRTSGQFAWDVATAAGDLTFTGDLSDTSSGGMRKNGGGKVIFQNNTVSYSDGVFIRQGTLELDNSSMNSIDDLDIGFFVSTDVTMTLKNNASVTNSNNTNMGNGLGSSDTATLNIESGADLTTQDLTFDGDAINNLTVTGSGSTLTLNDDLFMNGGGTVLIDDSASIVSGDRSDLGDADGSSTLSVTIDNSATWELNDALNVGNGGDVDITVQNGADITDGGGSYDWSLANDAASTVTLTIDGSGSTVDANRNLDVGDGGNATITMTNDAQLTVGGDLSIGDEVFGGSAGDGVVNVSSGADISAQQIILGNVVGSTGALTVDGSGSTVASTSFESIIGNIGIGTLTVSGGGSYTTAGIPGLRIANNSASTGTVNVTGTNSTLTTTVGHIYVGDNGNGTMNVTNGGSVTTTAAISDILVANDANSTSVINLSGATSTITATDDLQFGDGDGTVNLDGGTFTADAVDYVGSGTATIEFNGGTLKAGASSSDFIDSNILSKVQSGGAVFDTNGFDIILNEQFVEDATDTGGGFTKNSAGSLELVSAGANSFTGTTTVNAGTMILDVTAVDDQTIIGDVDIQAGTLRLDESDQIADTSDVNVATGATFELNNTNGGDQETIQMLSGGGTVDLQDGTLTIGDGSNGSQSSDFSGVLTDTTGSGDIVKEGNGTITLSGTSANTYSGIVTLNDGTLALGKTAGVNALTDDGTAADDVIINSGAILQLEANNQIADAADIQLNGGEIKTNGFDEGSGSAAGIDDFEIAASSVLNFNGSSDIFRFSTEVYTAGTLTIRNWVGDPTNGGTGLNVDRFLVESDISATSFFSNLSFEGWGNGSAKIITLGGAETGLYEIAPDVTAYKWDITGSGDWDESLNAGASGDNWDQGIDPDAVDDIVIFGNVITADATVTVNKSVTVAQLVFQDSGGFDYTVEDDGGGETITMDSTSGTVSISTIGTNAPTISANIALNDDLTFSHNSTGVLTISGDISGAQNVTKASNGTIVLSGTNTYTGDTNLNAGTLRISADANLGDSSSTLNIDGGTLEATGTFTLASTRGISLSTGGGVFDVDTGQELTVSGVISGAGGLEKTDAGTLTLSGTSANTFSGDTTLTAGTLKLNKTAGVNAIAANTTLNIDAGTLQLSASNQIDDTVDVVLDSGATFDLNDNDETIDSLEDGSGGGGSVDLGSGTLTVGDNNATSSFSGVISGTGNLAKTGTGDLSLNGTNTYSGSTTISNGTISISADANLGADPGSPTAGHLTLNGGTLEVTSTMTLDSDRGIAIGASNGTLDIDGGTTTTYDGIIAGTGTLTKSDVGTLILGGTSANTHSGSTVVTGGTLQLNKTAGVDAIAGDLDISSGTVILSAANQISDNADVSITGSGIFDLNGNNETVDEISGDQKIFTGGGTLTIGSNNGSSTFSGVISESGGSIVKSGSGTITLSGSNTYSGTTTVNAGTLDISGVLYYNVDADSGSTNELVLNGGTLLISNSAAFDNTGSSSTVDVEMGGGTMKLSDALAGSQTVNLGSLTLTANSVLDFGTSTGTNIFDFASGITTDGFVLEIWNYSGIANVGGGTDQLLAGSIDDLSNVRFYTDSGTTHVVGGDPWSRITAGGEIVPVPEPSTYFAGGALLSLILCHFIRQRRKKAQRLEQHNLDA